MYSLGEDLARRIGLKEEHIIEDRMEREIRRKHADWDFILSTPHCEGGLLQLAPIHNPRPHSAPRDPLLSS